MSFKQRFQSTLHKIRNPERSENEAEFNRSLGFKRLIFLLPFLIAAALLLWLALK